jgi:ABC-type uncharacterized transport system substrate-binding protein
LQATSTVPIVFAQTPDPVGAGFVASLARPGGNATGFTIFEYGISGKWLELLKEIAPRVTRVAVLRDPAVASGTGQLGAIQSVAPSFGVELSPVNMRDASEIERSVTAFAQVLLYPALEWSASALGHHGYPPHIRSHSAKGPERPLVPPDHGCDGETVSPFLQSNSQTSAGISLLS